MFAGGFYFISSVLDMKVELPVQITPNLRLQKATEKQIEIINRSLERNSGFIVTTNAGIYTHETIITSSTEKNTSYEYRPLDKENWKYYVLAYKGNNYEAHLFLSIANIIPPYITSIFSYHTSEEYGDGELNGVGLNDLAKAAFYFYPILEAKEFDASSLQEAKELLGKLLQLDNKKHEGIKRALDINYELLQVYQSSDLLILGLFIIIEMLITHNPNDKEIGDSIMHQIKTKIAFLLPRLSKSLDYSVFGDVRPEKIWDSLYHYRSCIAHGNHIDFGSRELKILKNKETAIHFLNVATKAILAHAIIEPDLVSGLKPI